MKDINETDVVTAGELQIALQETYPNASYGAVPVVDHYDALLAYQVIDDSDLSEVPQAFAAYLDHQRNLSV